jgi:glycosyltransferase involved in cell wall biosynthesis
VCLWRKNKPTVRKRTKPRLLQIVGSSKFGGDSVLILELARAAEANGYEVDILATDPRFQELIRAQGVGLVDLDVIRRDIRPIWDLRGLVRLARFLRASSYSLVHTHTSKPGIVGRLAATMSDVPARIHTVHLFPFHEESGPWPTRTYVAAERLAARWCDRIITVSEFHRDWASLLGIGKPGQVKAIPNGVPTERVDSRRSREEVRAELGVQRDFVVLSNGRLAEQKGLEYLVRAAPLLVKATPPITILLAGEGPLRQSLSALAKQLGVTDRVKFTGFRSDVGDLLAAADLVALPSLWEGLSISLLEAMAAGKAIVTTSIGSNREVTRDGAAAVLIQPKDPPALATAIRSLANDSERRKSLGRRAREEQQARYTLDRMLDAYLAEYDELLSTHQRRVGLTRSVGAGP